MKICILLLIIIISLTGCVSIEKYEQELARVEVAYIAIEEQNTVIVDQAEYITMLEEYLAYYYDYAQRLTAMLKAMMVEG